MEINKHSNYEDVQLFQYGYAPFGKPNFCVYQFFVDGLLIDTGQYRMRKAVEENVKKLPVQQVFITHHHEDHTGNLSLIQELHPNAKFLTSAACARQMKKPAKISFAQYLYWGKTRPFTNFKIVKDTIETTKYHFDLIPIPGHAWDMYALHEPNKGWLFSADLWVSDYIKYFLHSESLLLQIDSLRNVLNLEFDQLFCSHRPKLSGGKERIQAKLQFFEDFYGEVCKASEEGLNSKAIRNRLALKEVWLTRFVSHGYLSMKNMVNAVLRDEKARKAGLSEKK